MTDPFLKISSLIELRRYDQAREEVEAAIQESPDNPVLFHLSAHLFWLE